MSESSPTAPPPSQSQIFFRRLLSTLVLWAVILLGLFSGNQLLSDWVFIIILAALAFAGQVEFYDMMARIDLVCFKATGLAAGLVLMLGTFAHFQGWLGIANTPARVNDFVTSLLVVFVLGMCVRQFVSRSNTKGILAISTTLFGLMYVPWLLNFIQEINFFPGLHGNGKFYVLYYILVTKFSDMGAYAVGSLIGRHKMIPRISPAKTWEGFAGAIVVSAGASLAYAHVFADRLYGMNTLHAIIIGALLSMTAVVGDLIESLFKREAGVKDSGQFFPGIGGVLDLLDSLLFNAPIMYLYLRHILTNH
jgi:phosphatidate cytidylyltransferase